MPYFFTSLYSIPAVKLRDVWVMRWLLGLGDLDALCSGRYEWQETWAACQKRGVSPERTNLKDDSYDSWHNLSPGNASAATPVAFPAFYCLYWNCDHRCFIISWFKKNYILYMSFCADSSHLSSASSQWGVVFCLYSNKIKLTSLDAFHSQEVDILKCSRIIVSMNIVLFSFYV